MPSRATAQALRHGQNHDQQSSGEYTGQRIEEQRRQEPGSAANHRYFAKYLCCRMNETVCARNTMRKDAAADHEHRDCSGD